MFETCHSPSSMTLFHPNLRALRLDSMKTNAKLPTPISSHLLTSLALYGGTGHWSLKRDSVHFPLLEALSLLITHPAPFMAALVAPKLESFDYGATFQSHSVVLGELADRFSRVHRIVEKCGFIDTAFLSGISPCTSCNYRCG